MWDLIYSSDAPIKDEIYNFDSWTGVTHTSKRQNTTCNDDDHHLYGVNLKMSRTNKGDVGIPLKCNINFTQVTTLLL